MRMTRRGLLRGGLLGAAIVTAGPGLAVAAARPTVTVYKSPT